MQETKLNQNEIKLNLTETMLAEGMEKYQNLQVQHRDLLIIELAELRVDKQVIYYSYLFLVF